MASGKAQRGFTLLELLIVVAVIGIIAMIGVANLISALDRGKQKQTMSDLRSIATGLDSYAIDYNDYPDTAGTVDAIVTDLTPMYLRFVPTEDGWGNPLRYANLDPASDGAEYMLRSLGRDGLDDGNGGSAGETQDFDADIVIFDGGFTQWPAGAQQ